jgi:hypothetical protein
MHHSDVSMGLGPEEHLRCHAKKAKLWMNQLLGAVFFVGRRNAVDGLARDQLFLSHFFTLTFQS